MSNSAAAAWAAEQPFYPLVLLPSSPQTWQHLSGVWHSPYQTKHKDLLLYCYSTVKASGLYPHSPPTFTQRHGKVFPLQVSLVGHQESKRLCGVFIHRSNYYYNSRRLSLLLITRWDVSQPPCLETGPLQTHFWWYDFHTFCSVFYPSICPTPSKCKCWGLS